MRDRRGQRLACSVDLSVGRPRPHLDPIFLLDGHPVRSAHRLAAWMITVVKAAISGERG